MGAWTTHPLDIYTNPGLPRGVNTHYYYYYYYYYKIRGRYSIRRKEIKYKAQGTCMHICIAAKT